VAGDSHRRPRRRRARHAPADSRQSRGSLRRHAQRQRTC